VAREGAMLNLSPGRLWVLLSAERLDPYGAWPSRHHTIAGITRLPPVVDKM